MPSKVSKVSKTKVRMKMTRTKSAKMDGSSQPPAKTIKTSLENYHHLHRQQSQDGSNSDTNSKMSYEHSNNHHSNNNNNPSREKQYANNVAHSHQHHVTTINNPKDQPAKIRHKKVNDLVQQEAEVADKSSQSSSSCDEKFCELDGPICKRYQIKSRLGKGAYGIVWQAIEKATGNTVAVKKIFDAFRNDTDAQRTYREIMFLREFGGHPNIIRLLKVHRAVNNMDIYLVFPFMEHDLHRLIKNSPQLLKDSNIRQIFYQMLKAVKYLHSAEVIHRDLKPANILLDDYLNVKVGDFGLARSLTNPDDLMSECNPVMTDYVATRWYRPPEILLSCPYYTKGVDMWSLGCILAECVLLRPLFPGTSTIQQVETIMSHIEPPSAEEIEEMCSHNSQSTMIEAAISYSRASLRDIFQKCDEEIIDLIEKFLVFKPGKRITAEEALAHPYLAKYRKPSEEIVMTHPVSPPLNDYIQLPMGKYRSVIYELIQVRKIHRQQQHQQQHPDSPVTMISSTTTNKNNPITKSQSHSQGTIMTESAPGITHSSHNNNNFNDVMRHRSTTAVGNVQVQIHGHSKSKKREEKDVRMKKGDGHVQIAPKTVSCEKELSDYSGRVTKIVVADRSTTAQTIGPEGDGNGSHKIKNSHSSINNNHTSINHNNSSNCNTNYMQQQIDNARERMSMTHKTTTRKNNSTPNIPQVKRPGPDGDGHSHNNHSTHHHHQHHNQNNNLPLPYLKLVSTAPGLQGKNPRLFDRSELSARQCHPVPSDLKGADKRLFELYSNTDDLKEQIKAIEFQVRTKRENASAQWISDLSNNLNKATVSDNNIINNTYGRNHRQSQYHNPNANYITSSSKNGGRGMTSISHHHSSTKLPEILQSWNQGHNNNSNSTSSSNNNNSNTKMFSHNGDQVVRQMRRSTYFPDGSSSVLNNTSQSQGKFGGGGGRNMGRLSQMSEFTRDQHSSDNYNSTTATTTTNTTTQERLGSSSSYHQYPRSTTPIEVIHARSKHYESYSQTHGTISASDLSELKTNLGYFGKQ